MRLGSFRCKMLLVKRENAQTCLTNNTDSIILYPYNIWLAPLLGFEIQECPQKKTLIVSDSILKHAERCRLSKRMKSTVFR